MIFVDTSFLFPLFSQREGTSWPVPLMAEPWEEGSSSADPENGNKYYRARYYDPSPGRFLSEDPLGSAAGMNFYAYA